MKRRMKRSVSGSYFSLVATVAQMKRQEKKKGEQVMMRRRKGQNERVMTSHINLLNIQERKLEKEGRKEENDGRRGRNREGGWKRGSFSLSLFRKSSKRSG